MGENSEVPPGTLLRFPVLPAVGTCSTSCRERGNAFDKTACLLRCSSPFSVSPLSLILVCCRGCSLPLKVEILKVTTPRIGSHVDGAFSQAGRDDATSAQVLHGSGPVSRFGPPPLQCLVTTQLHVAVSFAAGFLQGGLNMQLCAFFAVAFWAWGCVVRGESNKY